MAQKVVSAAVKPEWEEHLNVLAARFSEELGREVTKSDVIRAFLRQGLEDNPVSDEERVRTKARRGSAAAPVARPELRIEQGRASLEFSDHDSTERGGFEPPVPFRAHTISSRAP